MSIQSNFPALKPSLLLDFANTKQLDPRITFTRASTATFYDGVTTAKAEENLLLQSQDFTTTWADSGITTTADTISAPDGTTTGDKITEDSATSAHNNIQAITAIIGAQYTFSVFAKRNGRDIQLCFGSSDVTGNPYANFDLSSGTVGTTGGTITAVISNAGNSWYRCSVTVTSAVTSGFGCIIALTDSTSATRLPSYAGDNSSGAYLWGAQLEQRSSVTSYTATTTQPITNYIPVMQTAAAGVARFDHNPTTGESLGLLIEEQRTNLLTYSEQFDNAAWTKVNNNITANIIVAPDGTLTGDQFVEDTNTGTHRARSDAIATTASTSYTFTVYAKANTTGAQRFLALTLSATTDITTGARRTAVFDLSNGSSTTAGGATFTLVGYGATSVGNGWYRCYITVTTDAAGTTVYATASLANSFSINAISYTGDGYSGIFIWGAQLEAGAFPTSYIPTVAAQVTRSADAASMTGTNFSSWYDAAEGTFYIDYYERAFGATHQLLYATNGTTSERINFSVSASNILDAQIVSAGADTFGGNTPTLTAANYKIALAFATNNAGLSSNASSVTNDTTVILPNGMSQLNIGATFTPTQFLNSTIRKIAYYPARVTDAQLQALTS